ncbi:hypothetical protein MKJ04_20065 [Pontibacter sp. E15-1]|uniref:DUF6980 family protein n=1 Tax=Pontibacter sp. E15-1 TaxID=2919918 RepID=UPI001F4F7B3E|nr:hypothetical protein [Pontibacter sp. E15-1]MCJ8167147.1 hypothetical protein [Pontibacter sp. E15-1]
MCDKLKEFASEDFENIDTPILYVNKFNEYGIKIMDGGNSSIKIQYCPWCGERLPESKRDQWFDELESLGINDPWS